MDSRASGCWVYVNWPGGSGKMGDKADRGGGRWVEGIR